MDSAGLLALDDVVVDADDLALARLDLLLECEGGVCDLALRKACLDCGDHPAQLVDLVEVVVRRRFHLVGELLDEVGAAERVGRVGDAGLVGDYLLGAERDTHRFLRRKRERLVERVGVERLRAAQDAGERLDRGSHDVEQRLLCRQGDARGLGVEAHQHRALVLGAVGVSHLARPDAAGGAVLRDLLEEVDVRVEEEAEARREVVDVEATLDRLLHVGEAILERERELLLGRRSGLADVVPGD